MTEVEQKLDNILRQQNYNKMCLKVEQMYNKFCESKEEKEFEELEIEEEQYSVDNLVGIIQELNQKLETLTEDYNDLLAESCETMEDIVYSIPCLEEII